MAGKLATQLCFSDDTCDRCVKTQIGVKEGRILTLLDISWYSYFKNSNWSKRGEFCDVFGDSFMEGKNKHLMTLFRILRRSLTTQTRKEDLIDHLHYESVQTKLRILLIIIVVKVSKQNWGNDQGGIVYCGWSGVLRRRVLTVWRPLSSVVIL